MQVSARARAEAACRLALCARCLRLDGAVQIPAVRVDGDEAGEVAQRELAQRLGPQILPGYELAFLHVGREQRGDAADGRKYTLPVSAQASTTSVERFPLPMHAVIPAPMSSGVAKSMRLAVVGPTEPRGRPAAGGDWGLRRKASPPPGCRAARLSHAAPRARARGGVAHGVHAS